MSDLTRALRAAISDASRTLERVVDSEARLKLLREARQNADYRMVTANGISEPLPPKVGREMVVEMIGRAETEHDTSLGALRDKLISAAGLIK